MIAYILLYYVHLLASVRFEQSICCLYILYIFMYIYTYYIYTYSLSKSNNYSLKSAHHKSVIISHWLNFENCETKPYINDVILRIPLYCKFLMIVVPDWKLSVRRHENLNTKWSCLHRLRLLPTIYIYIYVCNHENKKPYQLSPKRLSGNASTWAHDVLKCMSCHKAIVVITGRAHCFHDCI